MHSPDEVDRVFCVFSRNGFCEKKKNVLAIEKITCGKNNL